MHQLVWVQDMRDPEPRADVGRQHLRAEFQILERQLRLGGKASAVDDDVELTFRLLFFWMQHLSQKSEQSRRRTLCLKAYREDVV